MAYQSLYRRYRSQKFSEVLGQPHVTGALKTAVAEGRQSHAYLFSGPRGTGKTSTARVLAKALNCTNLDEGEPCSTCDSCVGIENGKSFDLHELDAASHNKVDDIRDLISKVQLGSPGRTKVYILDEVHMLSPGAENALLKTLEEPPDHVVFVLATTEPQKVVATIRSRTQHHEFHLLPADVLADHVRWVIEDAELDVADDAIDYVLGQGGGSARDTLSALDLVAAGGVPEGTDIAEILVRAIGEHDPARAIATVQEGLELGREPRTMGEDLLEILRNAFLASMGAGLAHLNDKTRNVSADLGATLGPAVLTRSLEAIGQCLIEMRQAADPRVPLEVTLLRLTRSPGELAAGTAPAATGAGPAPSTGSPTAGPPAIGTARIEALEAKVAQLEALLAAGATASPGHRPAGDGAPPAEQAGPRPAGDDTTPSPSPTTEADNSGPGPATPGGSDTPGSGPARRPRPPRRAERGGRSPRPGAASRPPSAPPPKPESAGDAMPPPVANRQAGTEPNGAPGPAPSAAAAIPVTEAAVGAVFATQLDDLSQKVRVRFKGGRILGVDGSTVRFGVPNAIHRDRCSDVKGEVEQALSSHFGCPVGVDVVIDDDSTAPIDMAKIAPPAPPEPMAADADEDIGPVEDLADANDQATGGVERITKAFPGSQVVDTPAE